MDQSRAQPSNRVLFAVADRKCPCSWPILLRRTLSVICTTRHVNLYDQARRAQAAGDLKCATQKYERMVALRPDLGEAYANLGNQHRGDLGNMHPTQRPHKA